MVMKFKALCDIRYDSDNTGINIASYAGCLQIKRSCTLLHAYQFFKVTGHLMYIALKTC